MTDLTLAIREAVVARMRATPALTALVPAASIYGERVPDNRSFPFIRTGEQTVTSFPLGCADDGAYDITIHGFATAPSSDDAMKIGAAINDAFAGANAVLVLATAKVVMVWGASGIIRDPEEPDTWHCYVDYSIA